MSTLGASAEMARASAGRSHVRSLAVMALPPAVVVSLLAIALVLLFTPLWVHFAMGFSGGDGWTATPALARELSDRTIAELLLGPGTFALSAPSGGPLYTADEQAHLRDVRLVLYAFLALALASIVLLVATLRRHATDPGAWRALARGGATLVVGLVVLGGFAALAFGVAFELFHRLLFPGGNWAFGADSNLIRLYPLGFWQLSAGALAVLGIAGGIATWWYGRRRTRALAESG